MEDPAEEVSKHEVSKLPDVNHFSSMPKALKLALSFHGGYLIFLGIVMAMIPEAFMSFLQWGACYTAGYNLETNEMKLEINLLLPRISAAFFLLLGSVCIVTSTQKFKHAAKLMLIIIVSSLILFILIFITLMEQLHDKNSQPHVLFNNGHFNGTAQTPGQLHETNFKVGILTGMSLVEFLFAIFYIVMLSALKSELEAYKKQRDQHLL